MQAIKIKDTDVILQDFEKIGQGKIIIADPWNGAFTCTWGAMGSNIKEFICRINKEYFADKLIPGSCYVFSGKQTARNVRKYIREEMYGDLPWFKYMPAQKELREKIKEIEYMDSENEFVDFAFSLHNRLNCFGLDRNEERKFLDIIESVFTCEPWHFIGQETSPTYRWLCDLHKKIIKHFNQ